MRIDLLDHDPSPVDDGTVYAALRDDVAVRFVVIAPGGGYELVHEDGDADGTGGVVLIEPYEVRPGDDDGFLAAWREEHARLAGHRGYLGARLYRGVARTEVRWVEVARWSSPLMVARAGAEGAVYLAAPG